MRLYLTAPPACEPITLEEIKSYLRFSSDQQDDFLKSLISAARASVETMTGRALLKQAWRLDLKPPYPRSSPLVSHREGQVAITVPLPPLLEIISVKIKEEDISYRREEDNIFLHSGMWEKAISIDFWAGYGETTDGVPPDLKMGVLMAARCLYEGENLKIPLLTPYKVFRIM